MSENEDLPLFISIDEAIKVTREKFKEIVRKVAKAYYKSDNTLDFLNKLLEEIHDIEDKREIFTMGFLAGKVLGLNDVRNHLAVLIEYNIAKALYED